MASRRTGLAKLKKIVVITNPFPIPNVSPSAVMVFRNGMLQEEGSDYTFDNQQLVFPECDQNDKICVWYC